MCRCLQRSLIQDSDSSSWLFPIYLGCFSMFISTPSFHQDTAGAGNPGGGEQGRTILSPTRTQASRGSSTNPPFKTKHLNILCQIYNILLFSFPAAKYGIFSLKTWQVYIQFQLNLRWHLNYIINPWIQFFSFLLLFFVL